MKPHMRLIKPVKFTVVTGSKNISSAVFKMMKKFPNTKLNSKPCLSLLKMRKLMCTKDIRTVWTRKRPRVLALPWTRICTNLKCPVFKITTHRKPRTFTPLTRSQTGFKIPLMMKWVLRLLRRRNRSAPSTSANCWEEWWVENWLPDSSNSWQVTTETTKVSCSAWKTSKMRNSSVTETWLLSTRSKLKRCAAKR